MWIDRCQLWEKDTETKEMKEQIKELVVLLRQSELRRKEVEKELKNKDQAASVAMATTPSVWFPFIILKTISSTSKTCLDCSVGSGEVS